MAVSQQQTNRLCARCGVSEAAARAALERTNGDLLSAALLLERAGQTKAVEGGSYSTAPRGSGAPERGGGEAERCAGAPCGGPEPREGGERKPAGDIDFSALGKKILDTVRTLRFEVWRGGKRTMAVPAVLLIPLLLIRFPAGLAVLAACLLLGCRYRLSGAEIPGLDAVNSFLDSAYALCADLTGRADRKQDDKGRKG